MPLGGGGRGISLVSVPRYTRGIIIPTSSKQRPSFRVCMIRVPQPLYLLFYILYALYGSGRPGTPSTTPDASTVRCCGPMAPSRCFAGAPLGRELAIHKTCFRTPKKMWKGKMILNIGPQKQSRLLVNQPRKIFPEPSSASGVHPSSNFNNHAPSLITQFIVSWGFHRDIRTLFLL